jgi:hypothetical protein
MCSLCSLDSNLKENGAIKERSDVHLIGSLRRRLVHKNNVTGKRHTAPEEILVREWKTVENSKRTAREELRNRLENLFTKQKSLIIKRLEEKVNLREFRKIHEEKEEITPLIVNTLIDWAQWFEDTKEEVERGVRESAEAGFRTALNRIDSRGPDFSSRDRRVRNVIEEIVRQSAKTQDTFSRVIANEIRQGLSQGDDMTDLVQRVADKTDEQVGYRLDRLVRTAGNGGFEVGQKQSFRKSGIETIKWLTQRDPRVRGTEVGDDWDHRGADGQEIGIDESFIIENITGAVETLRFPGDPLGSVGNIVYCRCTIVPVS